MAGDERQEILLGGPNEERFGLARAVRIGAHVSVGGTAPILADGTNVPADDVAAQAARCYQIIGEALTRAGATHRNIVRTRTLLVRIADAPHAIAARREFLRGVKAVDTIVEVARFVDPDWMIEVEVDAVLSSAPTAE